ncbi:conserved oligomeric golgi complex subunit 4-like protein [Trifolium pratense]|uniref:Conserved oligomeric golgi complex subunit 4-like protein n=1 Tax=Trifolium pratense TaxID=57577 RepID=A0A2K3L9J1_TRIPR|nr:conserved oligomeric golgi complex subunit 4-like protein [Trifolium pratense]
MDSGFEELRVHSTTPTPLLSVDTVLKLGDKEFSMREHLLDSKKQLEGIVRKKLSVVDQRDHPVILNLTSVDPELLPHATKAFRNGRLSKVVQDLIDFYIILEGFWMVENVRKGYNLATSMADNVFLFYVLQSWFQRALSTSNVSSVVAV